MNLGDGAPYRTVREPGRAEWKEKGSRFLAFIEPCPDLPRAEARIHDCRDRHTDATHVCWAWRLRTEPDPGEASSDAGEPAGTAGVPMLGTLRSARVWDVLGIVVRWYGGTNLGRGGLIRAYRGVLADAVEAAQVVEALPRVRVTAAAPMGRVGDLHRVLSVLGAEYGEQRVGGGEVLQDVVVPLRDLERLDDMITEATHGEGRVLRGEGMG
ncbi:MAG: YigZ family protein [bacterium]